MNWYNKQGKVISGIMQDSNNNLIDGVVTVYTGDPCGTHKYVGDSYWPEEYLPGEYNIVRLPAGTYYLKASALKDGHVAEWYGGTASSPDCSQAQPVQVTVGGSITGKNFQFDNAVVTTYTVTTSANPVAGGTVTGVGSYNSGATATLTAIPTAGYVFTGWSGDATGATNPIDVTNITANKNVVANFTQTYTVTTSANPVAGGSVTGGSTYNSGATATLTATPAAGYTFTGWSGDAMGTMNPIDVTNITANKNIEVVPIV